MTTEQEKLRLTTEQQCKLFGCDLIDLLRREGRHSGVWFGDKLLQAADELEARSTTPPSAGEYQDVIAGLEALSLIVGGEESAFVDKAADAIRTLIAREEEQKREWAFVWKWIERAGFDASLSREECIDTLLHYPSAPWNSGRWDVDHKPYAKRFYAAFPNAALNPKESDNG